MTGSLLILLVLFSWLGPGEGPALLAWLGSSAAVFAAPGERIAVRLGCEFRRPSARQTALLEPLWTQALAYAQLSRDQIDLYVRQSPESNAFAAGRRSVAVTTGVLAEFQARRLGAAHLVAILAHEIGHVETMATRFSLVTMWLSMPWRFLSRQFAALALTFARRQPCRMLAFVVVVAGVVVAISQAATQHHWMVVLVLGGVVAAAVICPVVDAAVSRRSEYAADFYVARLGLGPHLALALDALNVGRSQQPSSATRLLSRYPDAACRADRLVPGARLPSSFAERAVHESGVA